jgi:hypothetical protein
MFCRPEVTVRLGGRGLDLGSIPRCKSSLFALGLPDRRGGGRVGLTFGFASGWVSGAEVYDAGEESFSSWASMSAETDFGERDLFSSREPDRGLEEWYELMS